MLIVLMATVLENRLRCFDLNLRKTRVLLIELMKELMIIVFLIGGLFLLSGNLLVGLSDIIEVKKR